MGAVITCARLVSCRLRLVQIQVRGFHDWRTDRTGVGRRGYGPVSRDGRLGGPGASFLHGAVCCLESGPLLLLSGAGWRDA